MSDLYDLGLNDLVPNSIKSDTEVQSCITSLDAEFNLIKSVIDNVNIYSAIDTLPMDIIQLLAWQFNVSSENKGWTVATTDIAKRNLVKNSIRLHRTKGTRYAIENVLSTVGFQGKILEWFEYDGNPYHFKIKITNYADITAEKIIRLRDLVKEYKNARSYLEDLSILMEVQSSTPKVGIGMVATIKVALYPIISNADIQLDITEYNGVSTQTNEILNV